MKRKTPLVILSSTMETTCPELQTHTPLTCFFVLLPWKLGLSYWFPSLSHPCLSGDFGRKSALPFSLVIWCIYVFTAVTSLLFSHLSLTYSFHLSGNIYWAPVMFVAWCRHEEGRNKRRQILAVSELAVQSLTWECQQWRFMLSQHPLLSKGKMSEAKGCFSRMCPWENSHNLIFHERLVCEFTCSVKCELFFRNIFFLRFNSFRLCSTQRMPASFCSGEGVTPGGQLTAMNSPPDRPDVALGQSSPERGLEQFHWRKVHLWPQSWPRHDPAEFQSHPQEYL